LDKPSLLIAPARNALVAAEKAAAKSLTDYVTAALARGGDVMLPSLECMLIASECMLIASLIR